MCDYYQLRARTKLARKQSEIYGVLDAYGVLVICSYITKKAGATAANEILRPESFYVAVQVVVVSLFREVPFRNDRIHTKYTEFIPYGAPKYPSCLMQPKESADRDES